MKQTEKNGAELKKFESCVILIGATGTGKSSTINIMTGSNLKAEKSATPITTEIAEVRQKGGEGYLWLDNPGKEHIQQKH